MADVDEIALNPHTPRRTPAAPTPAPDATIRDQDIRLEVLKCAVTGAGASWNAQTVLDRASIFEAYVLGVKTAPPPDRGWVKAGS